MNVMVSSLETHPLLLIDFWTRFLLTFSISVILNLFLLPSLYFFPFLLERFLIITYVLAAGSSLISFIQRNVPI